MSFEKDGSECAYAFGERSPLREKHHANRLMIFRCTHHAACSVIESVVFLESKEKAQAEVENAPKACTATKTKIGRFGGMLVA